MKKYQYLLLAAFLSTGCTEDSLQEAVPGTDSGSPAFTAVMETNPGRAELTGALKINWQTGDQLSVFARHTSNRQYRLTTGEGTSTAEFQAIENPDLPGSSLPLNGAIYPYSTDNAIVTSTPQGLTFSHSVPSLQTYTPGSFDPAAFPMIAISHNTDLQFKNVCGLLLLQFTGSRRLTRLELKGNDNETIAGQGVSTLLHDGTPSWALTSGQQTIVMDCSHAGGVPLSDQVTPFYITLPPVTLNKGFTVTLTDSEGRQKQLTKSSVQTIIRNQIVRMPAVECNFSQSPLKSGLDPVWNQLQNSHIQFLSGQPPVGQPSPEVQISIEGAGNKTFLLTDGSSAILSTTADEFLLHTDCSHMFSGNTHIESIHFNLCNTTQVTSMNSMLNGCSNLSFADLSHFNTNKVTPADGLSSMFQHVGSNLPSGTDLVLGPDFIISSPQQAKDMFAHARIKSITCTPQLKQFIWEHADLLAFHPHAADEPTVWYNYYTGEKMEVTKELSITHQLPTFTLPLIGGKITQGLILWGDDEQSTYTDGARHTYSPEGTYTVTIQSDGIESIDVQQIKGISKIDFSKL